MEGSSGGPGTREGLRLDVVIPLRIGGSVSEPTKRSLAEQTFRGFEVTVFSSPGNANVNRNRGAALTRGHEYILFLDADIDLDPTFMEKMIRRLDLLHKPSYCYCPYRREGLLQGQEGGGPFDAHLLRQRNYISTMSVIRRSDFIGFNEDLERLQDWDLWLRMLDRGFVGTGLDEVLFTAVYKEGDISSHTTRRGWNEAVAKVRESVWNASTSSSRPTARKTSRSLA